MSSRRVGVASRSFSRHPTLRAELLARYSDARFNESGGVLAGDELKRFLDGCEKAIVGLDRIDADLLSALPSLKVVSKYGVGLDSLDLAAMERHGVALGWTPGVNRRSVAELVVAFAICLLHRVPQAREEMDELSSLVKKSGPVCLLCYERDHTHCHRQWIAEIIEDRDGVKVENLVGKQV